MVLEASGLPAAHAALVEIPATSCIALPHGTPEGRGQVATAGCGGCGRCGNGSRSRYTRPLDCGMLATAQLLDEQLQRAALHLDHIAIRELVLQQVACFFE